MGFESLLTMSPVTEEEYRLIEKMFLPNGYQDEPVRMSGEAFVLLFEMLRKQTFCKRGRASQGKVGVSDHSQVKQLDGLRFLWSFFSRHVPEQLNSHIQKRNEELKRSQHSGVQQQKIDVDQLMLRAEELDNSAWGSEISSICSSISYITASTSNTTTVLSDIDRSPVELLGRLGPPEEYYLDTPSSSDDEDRCSMNGKNVSADSSALMNELIFYNNHYLSSDISDDNQISLSSEDTWEML